MPSLLIVRAKELHDDGSVVEIVIWQLDSPLSPCAHLYKYRLYFGLQNVCRVRYDNERGKGDHKHLGDAELPYAFVSVQQLLADFEHDVTTWSAPL